MPYIKPVDRAEIRRVMPHDAGMLLKDAGELNYAFSVLIIGYLQTQGLSYQTCNDIVGALDNCKDEFKRRVQDPYEDKKIIENGDIGYERWEFPESDKL